MLNSISKSNDLTQCSYFMKKDTIAPSILKKTTTKTVIFFQDVFTVPLNLRRYDLTISRNYREGLDKTTNPQNYILFNICCHLNVVKISSTKVKGGELTHH